MALLKKKIEQELLLIKIRHTRLFDRDWYVQRNQLGQGIDPYKHYLAGGWKGSDPSRLFSNERYREANADVREQDICPLAHYLLHGKKENRSLFLGQVPGEEWMMAGDSRETDPAASTELPENQRHPEMPLVSVIIPTYNRASTIREACESVLRQSYGNIELIVVDDCSEDNTAEVVANIQDSRLRYIRHARNSGACVARNTGIGAAEGEYIAFQDSDDLWKPEKLEKQLQAIRETDSDVCFCRYVRIDPEGGENTGPSRYYSRGLQHEMPTVFGIGTQTLLIRRDILKEDRFDPEMPRFQDLELLMRLAKRCRFCLCDEELVIYRTGKDSISSNAERMIRACDMLMAKHPDMRERFQLMCRELAYLLLNAGEKEEDRKLREAMGEMAVRYDAFPDIKQRAETLCRISGGWKE